MSLASVPPELPDPENPSATTGLVTTYDTEIVEPDQAAAVAAGVLPAGKPRSTFRRGLEVFVENKLAVTGVGIFAFMILFCFVGPLLYKTNQLTVDFAHEFISPNGQHLLGTDASGFDVMGRLMVAGQISLEVGLAAAALATVLGVLWGAIAGYFGGVIDSAMIASWTRCCPSRCCSWPSWW